MKKPEKYWNIFTLLLFLLAVSLMSASCKGGQVDQAPGKSPSPGAEAARVQVVVSIVPLADFVRQVGGDRVSVKTLVPPGTSPHAFEPSPAEIKSLHNAQLLVLVGVNLEFWKDKLLEAADNPGIVIVELADGMDIIGGECKHGHENEPGELHNHSENETGSGNPHIWLSPKNAMGHVEVIRDALIKIDPAGKETYCANAEAYLGELAELDRTIEEKVKGFSSRKFVAQHSAWVYFARDYGLEQAGVIQSAPGKDPTPAEFEALVKKTRAIGAKAIFAEAQFSQKAAAVLAEECNCRVLLLEPLGKPPGYEYIELMSYNIGEIEKALK